MSLCAVEHAGQIWDVKTVGFRHCFLCLKIGIFRMYSEYPGISHRMGQIGIVMANVDMCALFGNLECVYACVYIDKKVYAADTIIHGIYSHFNRLIK